MALFGIKKKKTVADQKPPAPKYEIPPFSLWNKYSFEQSNSFRGCKRFQLRLSYARPICEANVDKFRQRGFDLKGSHVDLLHGMINDANQFEAIVVVVDGLQIGSLWRSDKYDDVFQALVDKRIEKVHIRIEDVVLDDGTEAGTAVYMYLKW